MRWLGFAGSLVIAAYSIWLLLLAYRVVGKPRGQDPKYDSSIEYWSGTFKILGFLGIVGIIAELIDFMVGRFG
jgi:hypothetical protein